MCLSLSMHIPSFGLRRCYHLDHHPGVSCMRITKSKHCHSSRTFERFCSRALPHLSWRYKVVITLIGLGWHRVVLNGDAGEDGFGALFTEAAQYDIGDIRSLRQDSFTVVYIATRMCVTYACMQVQAFPWQYSHTGPAATTRSYASVFLSLSKRRLDLRGVGQTAMKAISDLKAEEEKKKSEDVKEKPMTQQVGAFIIMYEASSDADYNIFNENGERHTLESTRAR